MADLEALAAEYLTTPAGFSAEDPCGTWCGDGDVDAWVLIVKRIRWQMARLVKQNQALEFPGELVVEILNWQFRSRQFKGGKFFHAFGGGTDEVMALVAFARRGVQLMYEATLVVEAEGGEVPAVGPMPLDIPSSRGDELWYVAGGVLLALVLLELYRARR